MRTIFFGALAFIAVAAFASETKSPAPTPARLTWWREARFGLFIHYGPVALTGQEISWSRANSNPQCPNKGGTPVEVYDHLYQSFNPTNFSANDWAGVAKMAGMKYVVLTAKHCDGFLLWHSKVDGYNISATPFQRDPCAELAKAVRHNGLKLGWYFSPMDWRDPDFRTEHNNAFLTRMQGELSELLSNYGKIDLMWFDYDGRKAVYDQANTYALVKKLQPQIIIDNRLDLGVKQGNRLLLNSNADYYTPEQQIGAYDDQRPWETCMTIGEQWSWKPNDKLKSPAEVVGILCRTVGGDGNLLLDVGPMPDGRIEPRQVAVLQQVGAWLNRNSESIYGTRGGPWKPTEHITSTRKGNAVYVHILKAAGDTVELPCLPRKIKSAFVLGGSEIKTEVANGKIVLHLPKNHGSLPAVIKLALDHSAMDIPAISVPAPESVPTSLTHQPQVSAARVQELQALHWGLFVCWSFSTFSGKEWTPGVTNLDLFAATDCVTDQWAKAAKDAGMGYILFLTKHHDGFCLWDTQTTDRKVTKAPLGRDVLAELKKSCDKYGLKLALYFSEGEWAWPNKPDGARFENNGGYNPEMKKAQLKELLTQYGPIEYIWFDHAVGDGGLSHAATVKWVKSLQPGCFVGFNHGEAAGDIRLGEMGRPGPVSQKTGIGADAGAANDASYQVAEFTYPILPKHQGGAMWFYSLPEHDKLCLAADKIYADYLGAVKCGNIFSLDVGPDYNGQLRAIDVETLHQVGDMIRAKIPAHENNGSPDK